MSSFEIVYLTHHWDSYIFHTRTHSRTHIKSFTLKIASISASKAQGRTKEMMFSGDIGSCHFETKNVCRATSETPKKFSQVTSLD